MLWFYRGFFIFRDPAGDGFDVRDASRNIIEVGCASVGAAKVAIDDYLKSEID